MFANVAHAHAPTYTFRHKHPPSPVPVCFQIRGAGGKWYSESIQYLQSSLPLSVPRIPLPSLYQAEVMDDSLFPSRTWQGTEKNRKENKGKRLSNYFKQHTKLMHRAEPSKGQHPESCGFPAVWGEGNANGISAELTLKGERPKERSRMGVERVKTIKAYT